MISQSSEIEALQEKVASLEAELEVLKASHDRNSAHGDLIAQRLRHLLETMPAGVIVIDKQGRISEANPAAENLLGTPLEGESWMSIISRSFAPRNDDGHEISLRDGRRVSLQTSAMKGEPGQLVLLTDQTETRLAQSRLSQYQRLSEMGRMMASLAHQIRTPLSAALLYASNLMLPWLDDDQRIKFATKVKSRLSHLEKQVSDMLIFARGETKLDERLSGEELLQSIDEMLDLPLAQYDADCEFKNAAEGCEIQCNKEALLGAILNIINNALQAGDKGQILDVSTFVEEDVLVLQIKDSGPGMDESSVRKALEPFYTTKSHGTGLGLAVAQVVAKAHQGQFFLASELGVGTTAQFRLPFRRVEGN